MRIEGIRPLQRVEGEREIARRAGERPEMIEARREGKLRAREIRPKVGFRPKVPQKDEGTRIDPLVSDPIASATMPAATAAPEPEDDPPAMRERSCGLRQSPSWALRPVKS